MTMMQQQPKQAAQLLVKRFVQEDSLTGPKGATPAVDVVQKAIESQMFHWDIKPEEVQRMQELTDLMVKQGVLPKTVKVDQILDLSWQQKQAAPADHAGH